MMKNAVNAFFRMDRNFDLARLEADLQTCLRMNWPLHFNQHDYSGSWTAIALRSKTGKPTDILAHGSTEAYADTDLLRACTYFTEILDQFPFEKEAVRLMRLEPGSVINTHRDQGLAYRYDCFRLHIPIRTAPGVEFIVGGKDIPMQAGECWYADFDLPHSVINSSKQERVHFVVDGLRNAWTDTFFGAAGYDFEAEKKQLHPEPDAETKQRMIEELERLDTDAARQLIRNLKGTGGN